MHWKPLLRMLWMMTPLFVRSSNCEDDDKTVHLEDPAKTTLNTKHNDTAAKAIRDRLIEQDNNEINDKRCAR